MTIQIPEKDAESYKHFHYIFPKLLSVLVAVGLYQAIVLNVAVSGMETKGKPDMIVQAIHMQSWGNIWQIVGLVSSALLISYFNGKYSLFWATNIESKLDEREKAVRNRVFLRAYRWFFVVLILGLGGTLHNPSQRVQSVAMYAMLLLLITLPSMIASFHKNAR
jgi:hypothetical protein